MVAVPIRTPSRKCAAGFQVLQCKGLHIRRERGRGCVVGQEVQEWTEYAFANT